MLGKTLMLGVISASAALGIVYFGTAPQGSDALESHPHDDVVAEKPSKTAPKLNDKRIEPRLPTVRKADRDERQDLASKDGVPHSDKDVVSKADNVKSEAEAAQDRLSVSDASTAETHAEAEPETQTRWLDQYLKKNKGADSEKAASDELEETQKLSSDSKGSATNYAEVKDTAEEAETPDLEVIAADTKAEVVAKSGAEVEGEAATKPNDARIFRIENGKLVEITPEGAIDFTEMSEASDEPEAVQSGESAPDAVAEAMLQPKDKSNGFVYKAGELPSDTTPLLSTVMAEAKQIKKPELRDQAFFEITEYALSEGRYDSARLAHDMIEQDELSYGAKSRIAVAFAQNGMPSKAFKVIEEVKEPELRDFMRLQVIEALIAPQNLPEMWQEKNN